MGRYSQERLQPIKKRIASSILTSDADACRRHWNALPGFLPVGIGPITALKTASETNSFGLSIGLARREEAAWRLDMAVKSPMAIEAHRQRPINQRQTINEIRPFSEAAVFNFSVD